MDIGQAKTVCASSCTALSYYTPPPGAGYILLIGQWLSKQKMIGQKVWAIRKMERSEFSGGHMIFYVIAETWQMSAQTYRERALWSVYDWYGKVNVANLVCHSVIPEYHVLTFSNRLYYVQGEKKNNHKPLHFQLPQFYNISHKSILIYRNNPWQPESDSSANICGKTISLYVL